jgi:hypothetical protein
MTKARKSLSIRLQPYEGTPMAEVADYLNGLDSGTMQRKVEDLLVLGLLAYARLEQGVEAERLRLTCLECCDGLEKHTAIMRLAIGVENESARVQEAPNGRALAPEVKSNSQPSKNSTKPVGKQIGSLFGADDD